MSRSGYSDDCDNWDLICYRGAVAAAIRGRRGQAFLLEMWKAMTSLPEPKLIAHNLVNNDGAVCSIGSVGISRGLDLSGIDSEDHEQIAKAFDIPQSLAREIMFENDDDWGYRKETPEQRWARMKKWVEDHLRPIPIEP